MRIIEERHYRIKPGLAAQFAAIYHEFGLPIQREYLQDFIGYFLTEVGELNGVVAIWGFDSMDTRLQQRDRMMQDPRWQDYLQRVLHLIDHQQTRLMRPTSFSPIQ
ncbi:NIPSNAP family protein [Ketogulonicigenium vulgare]|uniref:NIPSNAP family containing protein n=1 Tax=Ketogulonicigenium vulgare (strain WSH-001) TaxID=759362 RepID=F9Y7Z2_KETVW|nr:NIPSNAP family protein [Ketogulonicigenium vulgare]ADO42931.1 Putative NipSnap protein K02D10.1 [Ketogulonicigenium vulgare Y25]AEM41118.1 NIPSNAP family containing protein [Ketogulonicigenium vulgare WSH-001]ALJ81257.1 NIPSNAP domain containing protein [Ketogulonicigenium vulgare]ANW33998.1 NIPSNAP domain containing protein [Ketogulonicigenium vulgare]AOZ54840.1 NipSnap protein K02D10.1 [Ketogulonicigenium vulgare]